MANATTYGAVDQDGHILDSLVQRRRDKTAARRFFRKLLKGLTHGPRVIITAQLKSYGAAPRELLPSVEHRQHRYLSNRAANSHQPTRQRERRMGRLKSPGRAHRFLSAYGPIAQHFRPRRPRLPAPEYRQQMRNNFRHGGRSRARPSLRKRRVECHPLASVPSDHLKRR
jgi:putative transposase